MHSQPNDTQKEKDKIPFSDDKIQRDRLSQFQFRAHDTIGRLSITKPNLLVINNIFYEAQQFGTNKSVRTPMLKLIGVKFQFYECVDDKVGNQKLGPETKN